MNLLNRVSLAMWMQKDPHIFELKQTSMVIVCCVLCGIPSARPPTATVPM